MDRLDNGNLTVQAEAMNAFLLCSECGGYLRDATTVTECLHSFCWPCIEPYLHTGKHECPACNTRLMTSLEGAVRPDLTLQAVVETLFPDALAIARGQTTLPPSSSSSSSSSTTTTTTTTTTTATTSTPALPLQSASGMAAAIDTSAWRVDGVPVTKVYTRSSSRLPHGVEVSKEGIVDYKGEKYVRFVLVHSGDNPELAALPTKVEMQAKASQTIAKIHTYVLAACSLPKSHPLSIHCKDVFCGKEYSLEFILKTKWLDCSTPLTLTISSNAMIVS